MAIESRVYPVGALGAYKYVVVLSRFEGKILLSRHRARSTWETQGGHVEPGETPQAAARRELYEESGAADYTMIALCDYYAEDRDTGRGAGGMVFAADIRRLEPLPPEVRAFDRLPQNVTYPGITPALFAHLQACGGFDRVLEATV